MTEPMTITEFLESRIAEDETTALGAHYEGQRWYSEEEFVGRYPDCCDCGCEVMMGANRKIEAAHIAQWQPARVLAECAAKRAMINYHDMLCEQGQQHDVFASHAVGMRIAFKHLAAVYADHPDYRQEWAL